MHGETIKKIELYLCKNGKDFPVRQ